MKAKSKKPNWAIIGLGNPGEHYEKTRHNVGFKWIELLQEQLNLSLKKAWFHNLYWGCSDTGLLLIKPMTYMNRSGAVIPWIKRKFSLDSDKIIIAVDNMDLEPGRIRMKPKGSSAGHNGLKSLMEYNGDGNFYRLYIGIGRPEKESVVDHVLGIPNDDDLKRIQQGMENKCPLFLELIQKGISEVQNAINRS